MTNMRLLNRICGLLLITYLTKGDRSGLCKFKDISTHDNSQVNNSVCDNMAPMDGFYPPQTTPSPWKIYTYSSTIEQLHSQPVVLGSNDADNMFLGYVVTAKIIRQTNELGAIIGHFEPQWDASPICCGYGKYPNMLESAIGRVEKPNQTLLWTAPNDYVGTYAFVATFWKSSRLYWPNVKSKTLEIIRKNYK